MGFLFSCSLKMSCVNFLLRATFCFSAERKKLETAVLYTDVRYLMSDFLYLLMMWWFQVNNNNKNSDKDMFPFTSLTYVR